MATTSKGSRVIEFVRATHPVYPDSSLNSALAHLRESGLRVIPVVDGIFFIGVLWEDKLLEAVLDGRSATSSVRDLIDSRPPTILPNAFLEEAREKFRATKAPALAVVDEEGVFVGLLPATALFSPVPTPISPGMVGGLATPFGVYLTNGVVTGGVGAFALVATGALLFVFFTAAVMITMGGLALWEKFAGLPSEQWAHIIINYLPAVLFLVFLRVSPLAGMHAAEHMVVHAIERREPLTPETVERMPRVHPRCGTNLAVGAMLFIWLAEKDWGNWKPMGLLIALILTIIFWRRLGNFLQFIATTKQPTPLQIENAIKAGEELIENFKQSPKMIPNFGQKLLMSGLPFVMAGAFSAFLLLYILVEVLNLPLFGTIVGG